jgi:hypothetical protein
MIHIILVSLTLICILTLLVIALSGIKFYTLNSQIEGSEKDSFKLKLITIITSIIAIISTALVLFI